MNARDAILRAAAQVEKHPKSFGFSHYCIPEPCGSPGCALGWIGHYAGLPAKSWGATMLVPQAVLGLPEGGAHDFYDRMESLVKGWRWDAALCAKALRMYADKYHADSRRPTSALVADLMTKVMGERIPEDA